jgi:hypothetical protein
MISLFSSCKDEEETFVVLSADKDVVDFRSDPTSLKVFLKTNAETWSVVADQGWCHPSARGKVLTIAVDENPERNMREAQLSIKAGPVAQTIKVRQLGYESGILVDKQVVTVDAAGTTLNVNVTSNVPIKTVLPDNWIKQKALTRAAEEIADTYTFFVERNQGDPSRQSSVEFQEVLPADATDDLVAAVTLMSVTQRGMKEYVPGELGDDKESDVKLTIVSGTAESSDGKPAHEGEEFENSFDGKSGTIYHSDWNSTGGLPFTLTWNLDKVSDVDYLVYYPRTEGSNGVFGNVTIQYSEDGQGFTDLMDYDFREERNKETKVLFPKQVQAKSIRLIVKSSTGGFASCAEMEFYQKDPNAFDYRTLFADEVCGALKPGITIEEIDQCEFPFYRNLAYFMFNGKYDTTFRVHDFKAYPKPELQADAYKTSTYSPLDNPTGITVRQSETLSILVGDMHGQQLKIRVLDMDVSPKGDGFDNNVEYNLVRGLNRITVSKQGMVYVMYHTDKLDDSTAEPVKMHFLNGVVSGYYDSQDPKLKNRWSELLNNTTYKYFDVLGKYSHLLFETADFRKYTGDKGPELIDIYDKITYYEMEMMGLAKYRGLFRNRMLYEVNYDSGIYATSYRTSYYKGMMDSSCSVERLTTNGSDYSDALWAPCHEVGHVNQTRPDLRWIGMVDVTNNVMASYIATTIFGLDDRLQVEPIDGCRNRFSSAWTGVIATKAPHGNFVAPSGKNDQFCKLIPFWQLELYFGKVLGMTPTQQADKGGFYPEVFEYARNFNSTGKSNGELQLEFVYNCSKASGYDLTDFFDKWGFLQPVSLTVDDYGKEPLIVTQEKIDEVKTRIANLNLPTPDVALEYISDNTVEYYKTPDVPVVKGEDAVISGRQVTIKNWKNVVTYEVQNASGNVFYISSGETTPSTTAQFSIYEDWKNDNKIYAVSAKGLRTLVPVQQ